MQNLISSQQCPQGFIYNSPTRKCQIQCNGNGYVVNRANQNNNQNSKANANSNSNANLNSNRLNNTNQNTQQICRCLNGFKDFNNYCHNCTGTGQYPDPVNKICQCYQPTFYKTQNGSCLRSPCRGALRYFLAQKKCGCLEGFIQINGTYCQKKCGQNAYINGLACVCLSNLTWVQQRGGCFKNISSCPNQNQIIDSTGTQCICNNGYQKNVQKNICQKKCSVNQILSGSICVCRNGFQKNSLGGECVSTTVDCSLLQNQVLNRNTLSCICKIGYTRNSLGKCIQDIPNCKLNQQYSVSLKICICKAGYERNLQTATCLLINTVIPINCPSNSILKDNQCICNPGFSKSGNNCIFICGINQQYNQKTNLCQCIQGFGMINNICSKCPTNAPTTINNSCWCQLGLRWNNITNQCQINCTLNSNKKQIILTNNQKVLICQCNNGYIQNSLKQCVKIQDPICPPSNITNTFPCPSGSYWDSKQYRCICLNTNQSLINGQCKSCPLNQIWSGQICLCISGFNMINNTCLKCQINSVFLLGKCTCKAGFYNQNTNDLFNTICKLCSVSCFTCFGPNSDQCLTCKNPEDIILNGTCIPNALPCPRGFFKSSTSKCLDCGQYCTKCTNQNSCNQCIEGFQIQTFQLIGLTNNFCAQKCGDGKRFQYECDDGNLIDGDGCDSMCSIEKDYICFGGNPNQKSICMKTTTTSLTTKSKINISQPIRLIGQVAQVVSLNQIPGNLAMNLCQKCNDIIQIKLLSYIIFPTVTVEYQPTTKFTFLIKFKFNGIFTIPNFSYSIQINPKYSQLFLNEDMNQIQIMEISNFN